MAHLADVDTFIPEDHSASIRVYSTVEAKRAVVVKDDDLLQKWEVVKHAKEVSLATAKELQIWFDNKCFEKALLKDARNIMTSRYVVKWKWIKDPEDPKEMTKIIRMRLVLR